MSRLVDAVLFDLDGTLVDSHRAIALAMVEALGAHGITVEIDRLVSMIGPPMEMLAGQLGAPPHVATLVNRDYLRLYHGEHIRQTPEHEGATELLRSLHEAGVALGIVTNKVEEGARIVVEVEGWGDLFGVIAGRDTPGAAAKPSPEAARYALAALGVPAERAAFVGDTEYDVRCAVAAGIPYVIMLDANRDPALLRADGATHIVRDLEEAGAILLGVEADRLGVTW